MSGGSLAIGQIGLGGITVSHRRGYAAYGLPVVAGYDPDSFARGRFSADTPSATAHDSLEQLLEDPAIDVFDLATPHHRESRLALIETLAGIGKPVLIQKPLGMDYTDAIEYVEILERAGLTAMVNQNMCFTPGSLLLQRAILSDGVLGRPLIGQISARFLFDTGAHPWFGRDDRWWTVGVIVHHFGLLQTLFGPPETVYAVLGSDPGQPGVPTDGYAYISMKYPSGLHIMLDSTGTYYGTNKVVHTEENVFFQGTDAIVDWRPNQAPVISRRGADDPSAITQSAAESAPEGVWFPNAFGLAMAHFQQAIVANRAPLCSVQDNLYVMGAVEAAYKSNREGSVVRVADVMGDRFDADYGTGWSHGYAEWLPPDALSRGESA